MASKIFFVMSKLFEKAREGMVYFHFPTTAHRLMILMAGLSLLSFSISLEKLNGLLCFT
jgi:hypothetical protein